MKGCSTGWWIRRLKLADGRMRKVAMRVIEQDFEQMDAEAERLTQEHEREQRKRGKVRMLLWSWGQTMDLIGRKREEMDAFLLWAEDAVDTLGAQNLSGMPGGGGPADSVSRAVEELDRRRKMFEDAAADSRRQMDEMLRRKHLVDEWIMALPATQQRILSLRYIDGHRWTYIALKMNYSERGVKGHESAAVKRLAQVMDFSLI